MNLFAYLLPLASLFATASTQSPLGYWLIYTAEGDPSSIVEVKKATDGTLFGIVVAGVYTGNLHEHEFCEACSDDTYNGTYGIRKGEKVLGKSFMWGFERKNHSNTWKHGHMLRVKTGTVYPTTLTFDPHSPDSLKVDLHVGFFSKSVYWKRITKPRYESLCRGINPIVYEGDTYKTTCIDQNSY